MKSIAGAALFTLSLSLPLLEAHATANWAVDPASKCRVIDEDPAPGRSVHWTGGCTGGMASGAGAAEFSAGGVVLRRIEGTYAKGTVSGPAKISDFAADGKPVQIREGGDEGPAKITRYKDGVIATVTEFNRVGGSVKDGIQKIAFYRDGAVASVESGKWEGGKLNGACEIERYANGAKIKSIAGSCVNGNPEGPSKVRFFGATPGHDLLFEGPYVNGRLEGQGVSSEILTAASTVPAETCLKPGDVTLHYEGDWKSNSMNGHGVIESHFCSQTPDGAVHHVTMKAAGDWIDSSQNGQTLVEFFVDDAAPIQVTRLYEHGAIVSETVAGATPAAEVKTKPDDSSKERQTLCQKQPWICISQNSGAPFATGK